MSSAVWSISSRRSPPNNFVDTEMGRGTAMLCPYFYLSPICLNNGILPAGNRSCRPGPGTQCGAPESTSATRPRVPHISTAPVCRSRRTGPAGSLRSDQRFVTPVSGPFPPRNEGPPEIPPGKPPCDHDLSRPTLCFNASNVEGFPSSFKAFPRAESRRSAFFGERSR